MGHNEYCAKAEESGERAVDAIKSKVAHVSARARATKQRVASDEKLRQQVIWGLAISAGSAVVGFLGWHLWNNRHQWCPVCKEKIDKVNKKMNEAKEKIKDKMKDRHSE
uniref:Uncharacterized protein n=1 Tax=Polytomella parva TaxID=51329 RepID=A0A7S0YJM6_9CHLO|mmetsp:Transcript_29805/g.54611  ORF Transcript_29805/g.54611 Transcript_29805/m.54611 type:complete len:109 (+) Transcript_29805:97-423(+)